MYHWTITLAAETAEKGGLFDLNATLPFMAIQFLILVAVLNALFYRPITQAMDGRNTYVRTTVAEARERTKQAEALAQQYQEAIGQARLKAQQTLADAEATAAKIRAQKVAEAQAEIKARLDATRATVEQEKQEALQQLQLQVDSLSQQMIAKLLSPVAG
jgi:F-type H+-transporting ATPase subunit b